MTVFYADDDVFAIFCLDPAARDFIIENGGTVYISPQSKSSRKSESSQISIVLGKPRGAETKYFLFRLGEVQIFLYRGLAVNGPIRISLESFWRLKKLSIHLSVDPNFF